MKNLLPKRKQNSNKGTYGTVLNIAGCGFYTGAAYLSSVAPLKVGAGKSMLASVPDVCKAVSYLVPEVIFYPLEQSRSGCISDFAKLPDLKDFSVVSIGCGLSVKKELLEFFEQAISEIKTAKIPCIIDADGLNLLAKKNIPLPETTILTPHPKEMARLMDCELEEILSQPEILVQKCSEKYSATTILKQHETMIYDKNNGLTINNTGNSALAKAGSGDVLTGMIAGFIAQGAKPYDACKLAVYLHGKAGEAASKDQTEYRVMASDLLDYLPVVIKELLSTDD